MARRSSISSSDPAKRPPWALVTALGLLLVLEIVLRVQNPRGLLHTKDDRELSYRSVVPELAAYGAPEVVVVGSSRARRGVVAPRLRELLDADGFETRVGNFALGGAMAEEVEATVRRLVEASPPPRLVVWAISPREFELRERRPTLQVRYLWRPYDWWLSRRAVGGSADALLPDAVRNEAARHSLLVRYRFAMRDLVEEPPRRKLGRRLADIFTGRRGLTTLHGDIDRKHTGRRANVSRKVNRRKLAASINEAYDEPGWPRNYQAEHLEGAVRRLREAGVPLLFIELPTHPALGEYLPPETNARFRSHLRAVAARYGLSFVTLDELGVAFETEDFREHSHVNLRGAEKYTAAIAPVVAAALRRTE